MTAIIPDGGGNPSYELFADADTAIVGPAFRMIGHKASVHVEITDAATVLFEVSNQPSPTDWVIGQDGAGNDLQVTESGVYWVDGPYTWVRARITTISAGTVSIWMCAIG